LLKKKKKIKNKKYFEPKCKRSGKAEKKRNILIYVEANNVRK